MSLDDFVTQNTGKQLADHSGNFLGECVSLAKQYAQSVQGVPSADVVLQVPNGARQLYEGFDWNGKMSQYYDKIPYGQPRQKGDLVVWGSDLGQYGDVAIALDEGNTVFGQLGTPVFKPAKVRVETKQPLGYLRLKGEDMFEGRSAADWAAQAKDAEQYKQAVIKSISWKPNVNPYGGGMNEKIENITPVINSLEQFKHQVVTESSTDNDAAAKLNAIKKIIGDAK